MITPIETQYKGYLFRSRLEARWAVFFDALGLRWEYEPEGFNLPSGQKYLPDFKITSPQGFVGWYEIKPAGTDKCVRFQEFASEVEFDDGYLRAHVEQLNGDPYSWREAVHHTEGGVCPRCGHLFNSFATGATFDQVDEMWIGCAPCDYTTASGAGHPEPGALVTVRPHKGWVMVDGPGDRYTYVMRIARAAQAARSARFEHGQSGALA